MTVRVRFAPSPTGYLHLGGARTALYNWLWARKNGGTFILRIEDTDEERSTEASSEQILKSLAWLGLNWDEGPFYQSRRGDVYREALEKLIREKKAYRAFETPEELEAARKHAEAEGRMYVYNGASLKLTPAEVQNNIAAGKPFVWRFRCPSGETVVPDTLMGGESGTSFSNDGVIGDFPLTRAGTEDKWGGPLYNFCCAVDDGDMRITHVIRGQEHYSNAARQILLLEALGYKVPTYTHLPLIMKAGRKMSKRDGDADPKHPVSVSARRDLGYLPEATINFLALLGWSLDDKTEFFQREDLIKAFSLERLSKSNANFDEDKYLHTNAQWLKALPLDILAEKVAPHLERAGYDLAGRSHEWLRDLVRMTVERSKLLSDFAPQLDFVFAVPTAYEAAGAKKILLASPDVPELLRATATRLETIEPFKHDAIEAGLRALGEERGLGLGKIAQPVRMAVTGRTASPGLFDVLAALGPIESCARIRRTADLLEANALPTV